MGVNLYADSARRLDQGDSVHDRHVDIGNHPIVFVCFRFTQRLLTIEASSTW